ncbi:hypothetical protein EAS64_33740 [Trebonia kvetii]|uniref:Uncharacterized protein n=1 Tax=Trebonia kvetii TaxID=2480626 RepID=A0A6P2BQF6_9ACTN|nr:hypothetical protein [Trebonia kvetii]TVZ01244.1 hypothetical protein EAS64_33740 [Trebonia kvetii]
MANAVTENDVRAYFSAALNEYLEISVPKVAETAHQRYRYIPAEDYAQAMWLGILTKPIRFSDPWDKGDYALVKVRLWDEVRKVTAADDRFRRSVRAAEAGYATDDIAFYSTGLISLLLPVMVEADWDVGAAMQRASSGVDAAGVFIRANDPFSGAENYQVMLIDLKAAWRKLTEGQRRLLTAYYSCNQEDTDDGRWERDGLAASMGLTGNALRVRVFRAVQRLQDELGGADPWRR